MAMIDHAGVEVESFERSREFYAAALAPLGIEPLMEMEGAACGFGHREGKFAGKPFFWIAARGRPAVSGAHIAFSAPSRELVDAFHAAALDAGGQDNGEAGPRPIYHEHYYGAFVLDPDGNNVEAVCHSPAT
jgi:catechol 2,3-dioxygenase-like lactoylglutathione lyase family enzyme